MITHLPSRNGLLAYADNVAISADAMLIGVIGLVVFAVAAIVAAAPLVIARRRGILPTQGLIAAVTLWAILVSASVIFSVNASLRWNREYDQRVMSGYFDPQDQSDRPSPPWSLWAAAGATYIALVAWSAAGKRARPSAS